MKRNIALLAVLISMFGAQIALAQSTANFTRGDSIVVVTTVNVRSGPNGSLIGKEKAGSQGILVGGPKLGGGYTWWEVKYANGMDGWTAEDFMQSSTVSIQTNPGVVVAASGSGSQSQVQAQTAAAAEATPSLSQLMQELQQVLNKLQAASH